ncbi:hypothetical protein ACOMHN_003151 [Nucella lapillus]
MVCAVVTLVSVCEGEGVGARGGKPVIVAGDTLQRRTDDILSQLTNYETVIPELVDQEGQFLSYDVTHLSVLRHKRNIRRSQRSGRSKRRADNSHGIYLDGSDQLGKNTVFYKLRANGKEFHFNLTMNTDLLANDFVVEYWGRNGSVHRSKELWDCHYSGTSTGPTHTNAALSNCVGLYGMFSTDMEDYFVEPLWNHSRPVTGDMRGHPHPHLVYSRSSLKHTELHTRCGVTDYHRKKYRRLKNKSSSIFNEVLKPQHRLKAWRRLLHQHRRLQKGKRVRSRRRPRSVSRERHVETLVAIDQRMVDYYEEHRDIRHPDGLTAYVLTIMNIVAKLFHDPSIGNAINIVVTRLIVFTDQDDQTLPQINHHADKSLDSFCRWQDKLSRQDMKEQENAAPHDNAVLLTRFDICTYKNEPCGTLGLAPVEGMCEEDRSCSINQDIGLATAFIIAHEIGHNFGMHHDGAGNTCGMPGEEPARIMAARLTKDTSPFQWSSCSRADLTDFLE